MAGSSLTLANALSEEQHVAHRACVECLASAYELQQVSRREPRLDAQAVHAIRILCELDDMLKIAKRDDVKPRWRIFSRQHRRLAIGAVELARASSQVNCTSAHEACIGVAEMLKNSAWGDSGRWSHWTPGDVAGFESATEWWEGVRGQVDAAGPFTIFTLAAWMDQEYAAWTGEAQSPGSRGRARLLDGSEQIVSVHGSYGSPSGGLGSAMSAWFGRCDDGDVRFEEIEPWKAKQWLSQAGLTIPRALQSIEQLTVRTSSATENMEAEAAELLSRTLELEAVDVAANEAAAAQPSDSAPPVSPPVPDLLCEQLENALADYEAAHDNWTNPENINPTYRSLRKLAVRAMKTLPRLPDELQPAAGLTGLLYEPFPQDWMEHVRQAKRQVGWWGVQVEQAAEPTLTHLPQTATLVTSALDRSDAPDAVQSARPVTKTEQAKQAAISHFVRHGFPGLNKLHRATKIPMSTLRDALEGCQQECEPLYRAYQACKKQLPPQRASGRSREVDPSERAAAEEFLQQAIQKAEPADRSRLNAMSTDEKVAAYRAHQHR